MTNGNDPPAWCRSAPNSGPTCPEQHTSPFRLSEVHKCEWPPGPFRTSRICKTPNTIHALHVLQEPSLPSKKLEDQQELQDHPRPSMNSWTTQDQSGTPGTPEPERILEPANNTKTSQDLLYPPGTLGSKEPPRPSRIPQGLQDQSGPQRPSRISMSSSIFQTSPRTPGTSTTSRISQDLPGLPRHPGTPGSCSSHRDPIKLKQRDPIRTPAKLLLAAFPFQTVSFLYCIIQIVCLSLFHKPPCLKLHSDSSSLLCTSVSSEFHFFSKRSTRAASTRAHEAGMHVEEASGRLQALRSNYSDPQNVNTH